MLEAAVWESGGELELAEGLAALAGNAALVWESRDPARLSGRVFDLLVVAPGARGRGEPGALRCRAALVPGGGASLVRLIAARRLVSYGMGPANTLTLSSIGDGRAAVCVQREFEALDGRVVERQELVLDYDGTPPELYLARTGAALLLGVTGGGG